MHIPLQNLGSTKPPALKPTTATEFSEMDKPRGALGTWYEGRWDHSAREKISQPMREEVRAAKMPRLDDDVEIEGFMRDCFPELFKSFTSSSGGVEETFDEDQRERFKKFATGAKIARSMRWVVIPHHAWDIQWDYLMYFHHCLVLEVVGETPLAYHLRRNAGRVVITDYEPSPHEYTLCRVTPTRLVLQKMSAMLEITSYNLLTTNCEMVVNYAAGGIFISHQVLSSGTFRAEFTFGMADANVGRTPQHVREQMEDINGALLPQDIDNPTNVILLDSESVLLEIAINMVNPGSFPVRSGVPQKAIDICFPISGKVNLMIPARYRPDDIEPVRVSQWRGFKLAVRARTISIQGMVIIVETSNTDILVDYLNTFKTNVNLLIICVSESHLNFWQRLAALLSDETGRNVWVHHARITEMNLPEVIVNSGLMGFPATPSWSTFDEL